MDGVDSMRADIAELRTEMQVGFARMDAQMERMKSDLIKWSFVFWVGAVISVALLANVIP